jgi:hypothetical protein
MADKSILSEFEKASYWEEEFIMKYDTPSTWALLESLPKNKFEKIKPLLQENINDTKRHDKILKQIMNKIRSGKYEL